MDDGRADAVGCYGQPWARTPNMDRIATNGVRFDVAIVQNPVCIPSRKSMKTGFYAHEVGPVAMGKPPSVEGDYLDSEKMNRINNSPNLLDAWAERGIRPINVGKCHAFHRSFDNRGSVPALIDFFGNPKRAEDKARYAQPGPPERFATVNMKTHNWMIGGLVPFKPQETQTWRLGDKAVETLKELVAKNEPFFLRVSFHAPHVPCRVPKEYFVDPQQINLPLPDANELSSKPKFEQECLRIYAGGLDLTRQQINLARGTYYGMVALVDAQVGRLLKILEGAGLMENTIIAINSDQGFQLGEHGLWKKRVFYEQNVRVPLVLSYPGLLPRSKVVTEPVEMIDFLPTLLELSSLEPPTHIRGRSLMPLIQGNVKTWRQACFSEIDHSQSMYDELRRGTGRRVMVRTKDWKLIYFMDSRVADKDGALYDITADPDEKANRYADPQCKGVIQELEALAENWDRGLT